MADTLLFVLMVSVVGLSLWCIHLHRVVLVMIKAIDTLQDCEIERLAEAEQKLLKDLGQRPRDAILS